VFEWRHENLRLTRNRKGAKAYTANRLYAAFICSKAMNVSTVCGPSRKKYGVKPVGTTTMKNVIGTAQHKKRPKWLIWGGGKLPYPSTGR